MIYLGIDPGLDGAVAAVGGAFGPAVYDTPTMTVAGSDGSKKRVYAISRMAEILSPYRGVAGDLLVLIENVHAMPGQGVRSMFSMGYGLGLWEGLLAGLGLPFERVTPQRWKKLMLDGQGKDKDASRFKAQALFPKAELHLKKHDGRAEALLIAEYGRRTRGN